MEQVTVTITTDKPINVRITPGKDAFDELLDVLKEGEWEDEADETTQKKNA